MSLHHKLKLTSAVIGFFGISNAQIPHTTGQDLLKALSHQMTSQDDMNQLLTTQQRQQQKTISMLDMSPTKIMVNIDEAIVIAGLPSQNIQDFTIYYIPSVRLPEDLGHNIEYIIAHGGANSSETGLIHEGIRSGHYAFAILKNGSIFQFFDASIPMGGTGGFGASNKDAMLNYKSIAIEFSGLRKDLGQGRRDVEEPNSNQLYSAQHLFKYLKSKYNIKDTYTHRDTVKHAEDDHLQYIHQDGSTWSDDIYTSLNMSKIDTVSFNKTSINQKIQTIKDYRNKRRISASGAKRLIDYRTKQLYAQEIGDGIIQKSHKKDLSSSKDN